MLYRHNVALPRGGDLNSQAWPTLYKYQKGRSAGKLVSRLPPSRSLKVVGNDTNRSATYDFVLLSYDNHGTYVVPFPK